MIELEPRSDTPSDPDGVRVVARNATGRQSRMILQGLALFLAAACAGYVLMPRQTPPAEADDATRSLEARQPIDPKSPTDAGAGTPAVETEDATEKSSVAAPGTARPSIPRRLASRRTAPAKEKPDEEPGQQPEFVGIPRDVTAAEYIQALHDAGIYEGIGAFNPPGTSPPLEGLAVPEDYVVPEGYVKHYQATDDGQAIEPILMYHPDFEFLDANGNVVPIPEDRVVPADQAPPGFPIRPIVIPKPREERKPGDTGR